MHDRCVAVCDSTWEIAIAVDRAEWDERMDVRRKELNLAQEFAAEGRSYVELDDDGQVVRREPTDVDRTPALD